MAHAFEEEITFAVAALGRGEIVAYPTETFYGLGVDALDELALARLRALKGRDGKAISVLVDGPAMLDSICSTVPPLAAKLMRRYWPGALTIALPARKNVPSALVDGGFVAVRQSSHPTAQALVAGLGRPLTTTSANRAGEPPATTDEAVEEIFAGRCRVLHGGATLGGAPSTLVRVRGAKLEILRRGAIEIDPEALARDKG
ncbi:MAG TPA: L-threonylcarbamoyladenylate synthase [Polyangia bacterium]|jgi:L-threonylcarbamoyladenylate synthase|nr:L-threonylcarbamoyladenylate synthase [Polyangia bacterium]